MARFSATWLALVLLSIGVETAFSLDGRIVGGRDANIEDYPYQISMRRSGGHYCGASIVGKNLVLTAAHCIDRMRQEDLTIHVGLSNLEDRGTVYFVEKMIKHEKYNPRTFDNDIALIWVTENFTYGNKVKKIDLPTENQKFADGGMAVVTGWGLTGENGDLSMQLQFAEVPLLNKATCQPLYPTEELSDGMFCAGFKDGSKDACQADSGGPLVLHGIQVGVVSWGLGCGRVNQPGIYTEIAYYRDWIKKFGGI